MPVENSQIINVWYGFFPTDFNVEHRYWSILGSSEKARADHFKLEKSRSQYIYSQGKLRELLAVSIQSRPEDIRIEKGKYGKPFLISDIPIGFNVSHTGDQLAVAIGCHYEIGIDIEVWKKRAHLSELVKKCFAPEERNYWDALPEEMKIPAFYAFWTQKESFVKAVGRGIALGMDQCVIDPENDSRFLSVPDLYGPASDWKMLTLDLGTGISGALTGHRSIQGYRLMDLDQSGN